METKTFDKIYTLDWQGYVELIDTMGDDSSIVKAARVSYANGTKTKRLDEKLLKYLIDHDHMSPMEMCEMKFEIKAPIFVTRQFQRHRTASMNEESARYSVVKNEYYKPGPSRFVKQDVKNKQSSGIPLDKATQEKCFKLYESSCDAAFECYEKLLLEGVSREVARGVLPQSTFTKFIWKMDLRNLLHFIHLRTGSGAQLEIREYADAMCTLAHSCFPQTVEFYLMKQRAVQEFYSTYLKEKE